MTMLHKLHIFTIITFFTLAAKAQQHSIQHSQHYVKFIENGGQWDPGILFQANVPGGRCIVEENSIGYDFYDAVTFEKMVHHPYSGGTVPSQLKRHYLRLSFPGSAAATPLASDAAKEYYNFFTGNDPGRWATGLRAFSKITRRNIYPAIDFDLYSFNNGLKYDITVNPSGDPSQVKLVYEGAGRIELADGRLVITTSVNQVIEEKPFAYQFIGGEIKQVPCAFVLNGDTVSFRPGWYDKRYALVIDPILIFSTYSGSTADNFGFTATYDSHGHLYAGGITSTNLGGNYPTTPGAYQETFAGGNGSIGVPGYQGFPCDISLSKYDSTGTTLLFATYLGGASNEYPHSLVVDANDNLFVFGSTYSTNYPVSQDGYDTTANGNADMIISKLSPDGKLLLGSTYMGGNEDDGVNISPLRYNYADEFRGEINVDPNDNIYVSACTKSDNFPTTAGVLQPSKGLFQDGVVIQLKNDLTSLTWGTYLGGAGNDAVYSVDIDKDGNLVVAGGTNSNDLPSTNGTLHTNLQGQRDGFVAVIDKADKKVKYLTYYGTSAYDQVYMAEVDAKNDIYITGQTEGVITPTPGVYNNVNCGQFITKLNHDLSAILFQTVVGARHGNPDFSPCAFLVDKCENVYLSGWGSDIGYPGVHKGSTVNLPVTSGAIQPTTDSNDFYLIVLGKNAVNLLYATYFGGSASDDHVDGGTSRFDKNGIVYQSVCASCPGGSDFPTKAGSYATTNVSPRCSNAAFKLDFQITNAVTANFTAFPTIGCLPLQVTFTNKSKAKKVKWDFGDGSPEDTTRNPVHTYTQSGKFTVMMVVTDSLSCNINDTFIREIEAYGLSHAGFEYDIDICKKEVSFTNTSSNVQEFIWDFGDGTRDSTTYNPRHTYSDTGTYSVTIWTNPGTLCADSFTTQVHVDPLSATPPFFPNVFTPDYDGLNDCFQIHNLSPDCDSVNMRIYNRWGELLFSTTTVNDCWNGFKFSTNIPYPAGVYFYLVEVIRNKNDKDKMVRVKRSGTITLIR